MSRGKNLQEMEVGTKQSKTAVNASAKPAEGMPKLTTGIPDGQSTSWEDLGGPTPDNYRSTDDSSKLKDPGTGLKQVKDVVNKGAKAAEGMKGLKKSQAVKEEEDLEDENCIEEEITDEEEVISEAEHEDEEEEDDEDGKKKSKKSSKEEDEEDDEDEEVKEEFDIEEDVNALLSGEELSEEFQEKARTIFEAALRSKVSEIRESLEMDYQERLVEEVSEIKSILEDRIDAYLEYVSEEWVSENALAIEQGIKEELTESFITGMKTLFEEHYVEIPEDKYNVLEGMVERLDEMENKLNEQIERNVQLNKRLSEAVSDTILNDVSEGLALTQKEKLAGLAESVEFESEEDYREKLETLKESYFKKVAVSTSREEVLNEGATEEHSPQMNAYLQALGKFSK